MLDAFLTVCFVSLRVLSDQNKFFWLPSLLAGLALQFMHSQKTDVEEGGAECLTMDGITKASQLLQHRPIFALLLSLFQKNYNLTTLG